MEKSSRAQLEGGWERTAQSTTSEPSPLSLLSQPLKGRPCKFPRLLETQYETTAPSHPRYYSQTNLLTFSSSHIMLLKNHRRLLGTATVGRTLTAILVPDEYQQNCVYRNTCIKMLRMTPFITIPPNGNCPNDQNRTVITHSMEYSTASDNEQASNTCSTTDESQTHNVGESQTHRRTQRSTCHRSPVSTELGEANLCC